MRPMRVRRLCVRQVEVAERLVLIRDGRRQQRLHGRVPVGKADRLAVGGHVVEPQRDLLLGNVSEQALSLRGMVDGRLLLVRQAEREELHDLAVLVEDAEGRVLGLGHVAHLF